MFGCKKFKNFYSFKNMSPFNEFMTNHIHTSETEGQVTNTGLPPQRGKWHITKEEYEQFIKVYAEEVERGKHMHLTELHEDWGPMVIDIDFRFGEEIGIRRTYTEEDVKKIVVLYHDQIKHYFDIDMFKAYVFEKPAPYKSDGYIKDGIHIVYPTVVTKPDVQYEIRENVIELAKSNKILDHLNLKKDYNDVFDEAVIKKSGWLMYGSCKFGQPAYQLTKVFDQNMEPDSFPELSFAKMVQLFSIRNADQSKILPVKVQLARRAPPTMTVQPLQMNSHFDAEDHETRLETVRKLVDILNKERANNRNNWIDLGICLFNIDKVAGFHIWESFSKRSDKFKAGECEKKWKSFEHHRGLEKIRFPSLNMWARVDNTSKYNELKRTETNDIIMRSLDCTHYDVAELMYNKYRYQFVCANGSSNLWYQFTGHRWKELDRAKQLRMKLSTEVHKEYGRMSAYFKSQHIAKPEEKEWETKVQKCDKLLRNVKDRKFKDNVMKECEDQFDNEKFKLVLDSNLTLIGFNNGVFDLDRLTFRDGRPEDYLSFNVGYDYVPYSAENADAIALKTFLMQILPDADERTYVLMLMSTFLSGKTDEQKFHIWTGCGSNGKSQLLNLIELAFGDYAMKLPVTVLTQKRVGASACNPEILLTKGKRFVSFQEPEKEDKIHVGYMKELTGGDSIMARGLHKNPINFKPQFKMVLACNDLPKIPSTDGGTWRRLRVVQFQSKFVDDPDPNKPNEHAKDISIPQKLKQWKTAFMGILIEMYGEYKRSGKLHEPESVLKYTNEYKRKSDALMEFISEFVEETNDAKEHIMVNDFLARFKDWHVEEFGNVTPSRTLTKESLEKRFGIPHRRHGWRKLRWREAAEAEGYDSETDSII